MEWYNFLPMSGSEINQGSIRGDQGIFSLEGRKLVGTAQPMGTAES